MTAFRKFSGLTDYQDAITQMETHIEQMIERKAEGQVWLLEHPSIYTLGTSARSEDILNTNVPCFVTGRGGQVTYHGPGQRIAYVMIDLSSYGRDLHRYIWLLEEWLILTLQDLGITSMRQAGRVGLWICKEGIVDKKIAALGIRVKKWFAFHGISLNINPDLRYYQGIIPCGLASYGVTSLADLGIEVDKTIIDQLLMKNFAIVFGVNCSSI